MLSPLVPLSLIVLVLCILYLVRPHHQEEEQGEYEGLHRGDFEDRFGQSRAMLELYHTFIAEAHVEFRVLVWEMCEEYGVVATLERLQDSHKQVMDEHYADLQEQVRRQYNPHYELDQEEYYEPSQEEITISAKDRDRLVQWSYRAGQAMAWEECDCQVCQEERTGSCPNQAGRCEICGSWEGHDQTCPYDPYPLPQDMPPSKEMHERLFRGYLFQES